MNDYQEPPPQDRTLSRAQRRRFLLGRDENPVAGRVGCKFCKSTNGTYEKAGNRFYCVTPNCKGN